MQTKTLRLAAYFLIAHYLIVTGLMFLGKGSPDIVRVALSFGLLLGAIGALFKPRKRGWVAVVLYAVYAMIPILMGAWAVWTAPGLPSLAKITASIVLAVINSPLIVALVLVFMPDGFASFKNPPDTAAAQAATPAGSANKQRTHALAWTVLTVVVVVAAVLAVYAYRTDPRAQWMTSAQFQREFDTRAPKNFYPHDVEGECQRDGEKYRADWKAVPPGAGFYSHFGMSKEDYDRKNREYGAQGFSLASLKQFKDCKGVDRYQATWLKRSSGT